MKGIEDLQNAMARNYHAQAALQDEADKAATVESQLYQDSVLEMYEDLLRFHEISHPKYSDFEHGGSTFISGITDLTGLPEDVITVFTLKAGQEGPQIDILVTEVGRRKLTLSLTQNDLTMISVTTNTGWGKRELEISPFLSQSNADSEQLTTAFHRLQKLEYGHSPDRTAFARSVLDFAIHTVTDMEEKQAKEREAKLSGMH